MFSLRRETDYALQFLKILSKSTAGPASLKKISIQTGISFLFLQKIARKLRMAGIIKSAQGVDGGYEINVHPKKITLKEVITVMEGGCSLWSCHKNDKACGSKDCVIKENAGLINERILKVLDKVKVADL